VEINAQPDEDRLTLFTSRHTRKVGLGLPLGAATQRCNGDLLIDFPHDIER
jgi:hypothetical protein